MTYFHPKLESNPRASDRQVAEDVDQGFAFRGEEKWRATPPRRLPAAGGDELPRAQQEEQGLRVRTALHMQRGWTAGWTAA